MPNSPTASLETHPCDAVDAWLANSKPADALAQLADSLIQRGELRALLDARLLQARIDLGLSPLPPDSLVNIPEPARSAYEERYVAAIREVAGLMIERGEFTSAWPYLRAIGEPEPLAKALDRLQIDADDDRLPAIIDLALHQGVNPRKGFELILKHYGPCNAISSFELLPPDETARAAGAESLIRTIHTQLVANLRADIEQHGEPVPAESDSIPQLLQNRDWLFADDAYHIDTSHLSAVVRYSPQAKSSEAFRLARELCEYGRNLSDRLRYEGDPPFENTYIDHAAYLDALLGEDPQPALDRLKSKLDDEPSPAEPNLPAAIALVNLLVRLNRIPEAAEIHAKHIYFAVQGLPSLESLCMRAQNLTQLANAARGHDDPVRYAAAILAKKQLP